MHDTGILTGLEEAKLEWLGFRSVCVYSYRYI